MTARLWAVPIRVAVIVGLLGASLTPSLAGAESGSRNQLARLADTYLGSTVNPQNGDQNPYGLAVFPGSTGLGVLQPGDVVVSDINNQANVQGKGTSIVIIRHGVTMQFSRSETITAPIALAFNANGSALWSSDFGNADNGSLGNVAVLTAGGAVVGNGAPRTGVLTGIGVAGPWGMAYNQGGPPSASAFFWTNALDGTVWRVGPALTPPSFATDTRTEIASGLGHQPSSGVSLAAGNVVGPQGMAYDPESGILYVADSANDRVLAIPDANSRTDSTMGTVVYSGGPLHTPQGLAIDPTNGNLLVVNGALNNSLIAIDPEEGRVVGVRSLDGGPPGALFGLTAITDANGNLVVYYVNDNDNDNSLHSLTERQHIDH